MTAASVFTHADWKWKCLVEKKKRLSLVNCIESVWMWVRMPHQSHPPLPPPPPFSMTSFTPHVPLMRTPLSRSRPAALPSLLFRSCDLITPLLISFDRRRLIRGQHLDGPHGNRQDQIFWALKGGLGSGWRRRGWGTMRNSARLTAVMDGAEQRP